MKVSVKPLSGTWDLGYSLDKHMLSSVYTGDNQWGHPTFDNTRTDIGEALYQLKYCSDFNQVSVISSQLYESLSNYFSTARLIIPMPPSKSRAKQPVIEIARQLSIHMGIPCYENLLVKTTDTPQMKDIASRKEKVDTLINAFTVNDLLGEGLYDVLIVDDLFDTGSSLEAATAVLRNYKKIRYIYVSTVTRKR